MSSNMAFLIFGMNIVFFYQKLIIRRIFIKEGTLTFDHLSAVIKGQDIVNILEKDFKLLSMMK